MSAVFFYKVPQYNCEDIQARISDHLPEGKFRRIVLKPNWVIHEQNPASPIAALVTHVAVIEGVLRACLEKYPQAETITIGDCPVQSCDWDLLCRQSGLDRLKERYKNRAGPAVSFLDLRQERYRVVQGFLEKDPPGDYGDPHGYCETDLGITSFLDEISAHRGAFRVSDYDPRKTAREHHKGIHRYCVCKTILEADLFINLPKMKTHKKAGITGALKNLVGVNGNKAHLAHHRERSAAAPPDKFPPDVSFWFILHEHARRLLQKRSAGLFRMARGIWQLVKKNGNIKMSGQETPENSNRYFLTPGSWYGNDTIWRMVYDINRIVRYADKNGRMQDAPARAYLSIMDGIIAGEGCGPLNPQAVDAGVLLVSDDPFQMDMTAAHLMGFSSGKIRQLAYHKRFNDVEWGALSPDEIMVQIEGGLPQPLSSLKPVKQFDPPPGWAGHIEAV
jgi:uncharacterized protein (DUF362 family)